MVSILTRQIPSKHFAMYGVGLVGFLYIFLILGTLGYGLLMVFLISSLL